MDEQGKLVAAVQLFKVLGNESRLGLVRLLGQSPRTVGALVEASGLSQPLVSQHLRTLRQVGLVTSQRHGKEVLYEVADTHVTHVIDDALIHVQEPTSSAAVADDQTDQHHEKEDLA